MNRGLLIKTMREVWFGTLVFGFALALFQALLAYILPTFYTQLAETLGQLPFVQAIFEGLLGTDLGGTVGPAAMTSFAWVHPIVLALIWAHEITFCTRMPAGEIDRGTIDVLLSLPISRIRMYLCETTVWAGSGLVVVLMGLLGNWIGGRFVPDEFQRTPKQLTIVVLNLYCLYLAVGGGAWLVSALSDRRGRAVGIIFGVVLASFLLNFLAQFWGPAEGLSFLSVLTYYRPLRIVQNSAWPIADMLVLTIVGAAFWLGGAIVFTRRDISTV